MTNISQYLPNPYESQVVLVGVSEYRRMARIPGAVNNINGLAQLLTNPSVWGLPNENCHVVENPVNPYDVLDPLHDAARKCTAGLLFYFAGHGLLSDASDLCLTLVDGDYTRRHHTVRFADVREQFVNTARGCSAKVVLLDCCFAGRADTMGAQSQLADVAVVNGAYTMTATDEFQLAKAPESEFYTAFTGSLIHNIQSGVPEAADLLDMETLLKWTAADMRARNFPEPQGRGRGLGHRIAIARNLCFPRTAPENPWRPGTPSNPPAIDSRKRAGDVAQETSRATQPTASGILLSTPIRAERPAVITVSRPSSASSSELQERVREPAAINARKRHDEVVREHVRIFGPDHRCTLAARFDFAGRIGRAGDAGGAARLYRELASHFERIHGPHYRGTLASLRQEANWIRKAGDTEQATVLYKRLAEYYSRKLGSEHRLARYSANAVKELEYQRQS